MPLGRGYDRLMSKARAKVYLCLVFSLSLTHTLSISTLQYFCPALSSSFRQIPSLIQRSRAVYSAVFNYIRWCLKCKLFAWIAKNFAQLYAPSLSNPSGEAKKKSKRRKGSSGTLIVYDKKYIWVKRQKLNNWKNWESKSSRPVESESSFLRVSENLQVDIERSIGAIALGRSICRKRKIIRNSNWVCRLLCYLSVIDSSLMYRVPPSAPRYIFMYV